MRRDGKTRLMSFSQLGDLVAECGQVETELPETLRGPHALFGAFDSSASALMARARLCRTSVIGARELSPGNPWIAGQATDIIRARPSVGGPEAGAPPRASGRRWQGTRRPFLATAEDALGAVRCGHGRGVLTIPNRAGQEHFWPEKARFRALRRAKTVFWSRSR